MIPYIALLLIPALISAFAIKIYKKSTTALAISFKRDNQSSALPVFFVMLLLLLALRDESVGNDTQSYEYMFYEYPAYGASYIFSIWQETLFRAFNWLIMRLTGSFRVFLFITSAICVLPIAHVYNKEKTHSFLKLAVFLNMSTFVMLFSGIRQSMAMAVGMLAYQMVKEKKHWQFLLLATVAMLIHHSGLMVYFMYPLYHIRFRKAHLLAIIPALIVTYVFNNQIFNFLTEILESTYEKYAGQASATGAYGSLILFALFAIFSYFVLDEQKCGVEALGLRNFLMFSVVLQCFAPVHNLAMRMNYYYILFIPLCLGKTVECPKKTMGQVARVGTIVITAFFAVKFLWDIYQANVTGLGMLHMVPYIPFWR